MILVCIEAFDFEPLRGKGVLGSTPFVNRGTGTQKQHTGTIQHNFYTLINSLLKYKQIYCLTMTLEAVEGQTYLLFNLKGLGYIAIVDQVWFELLSVWIRVHRAQVQVRLGLVLQ